MPRFLASAQAVRRLRRLVHLGARHEAPGAPRGVGRPRAAGGGGRGLGERLCGGGGAAPGAGRGAAEVAKAEGERHGDAAQRG